MPADNPVSSEVPKAVPEFKPEHLDSLDARIIQYKYALTKLKYFTGAIDDLLEKSLKTPDGGNLVLIQYITDLAYNLFAISDNTFSAKLSGLEKFKTLRGSKTPISQVVTHVPYDMKDQPVTPLEELPGRASSIACLKSLKMMCVLCKEGYQKRLENASRELNNPAFISDLDFLFEHDFFNVSGDFDLSLNSRLFPDSSLEYQVDSLLLSSEHYSEAALIDMDLKSLFVITSEIQSMLDYHKPLIAKFKGFKLLSITECERQFRDLPYSSYALHRIFFWSLRINEIYFILRRFGRQIYVSNYNHLHDQNFLLTLKNPSYFKKLLNDMDELLLTTKKNGVLIATITRFIRLNSQHATSSKNVFSFIGYINQSVTLIESEVKFLQEIGKLWMAGELSFREQHKLPVESLFKLSDVLEKERVSEIKAARLKASLLNVEKTRSSISTRSSPAPPEATKSHRLSRALDKPSSQLGKVPDKSLSKLLLDDLASKATRNESPRNSLYLRKNSSSNSLQLGSGTQETPEKTKALTTTAGGRKRSDSQPISFNAAATALKASSPVPKSRGPLSSPSGSIRRSSSITSKPSGSIASPLSKRTIAPDDKSEIDEKPQPQQLTASQKFQQHLLEASKSGALVGKEKKQLQDVIFDPSNPLGVNLRKQATNQKDVNVTKDEPTTEEVPKAPSVDAEHIQRPTRSQVTKRNTQRNSAIFQVETNDIGSIASQDCLSPDISEVSSRSSQSHDSTAKKVRFTGVPEYTPAEDEPSSQLSRILKKFATLKTPLIKSLRYEEGRVLKHEAEVGNQFTTPNLPGFINTTVLSPLRLTRFKNRF